MTPAEPGGTKAQRRALSSVQASASGWLNRMSCREAAKAEHTLQGVFFPFACGAHVGGSTLADSSLCMIANTRRPHTCEVGGNPCHSSCQHMPTCMVSAIMRLTRSEQARLRISFLHHVQDTYTAEPAYSSRPIGCLKKGLIKLLGLLLCVAPSNAATGRTTLSSSHTMACATPRPPAHPPVVLQAVLDAVLLVGEVLRLEDEAYPGDLLPAQPHHILQRRV